MVSQELLEILRCPNCVRDDRPDPGLLTHTGNWLVCQDCDRKYPIRDDIPVMLIEEGDRFRELSVEELPEVPPPEKRAPAPVAPRMPAVVQSSQKRILILIGLALGVGVAVLIVMWLLRDQDDE